MKNKFCICGRCAFFLSNPRTTLPNLLSEVGRFHDLSNFKMNLGKSVIMPFNIFMSDRWALESLFPFLPLNTLVLNYQRISEISTRPIIVPYWSPSNLNWRHEKKCKPLGWAAIKMMILPKFLYFFGRSRFDYLGFFLKTHCKFTKFVWHGEPPCLSYESSYDKGLPDPSLYY